MLTRLAPYVQPILTACVLFPFAAAVFTLPFTILNYRKYGGIAIMRVLVVYSFILYSMCAFLLTVLPLPSRETVAAMAPHAIGWVPFRDLAGALQSSGVLDTPLSGDAWLAFLKSPQLFQVLANIIMQVPLGIYLRYYFRCSWKKTLLIGLGVSLFYELTQLSGLFFIYPKAYRFTEMDDLICNTLGAMIGYLITPVLCHFLPTRDEIDDISYRKGERLTVIRRVAAALVDAIICCSIPIPLLHFITSAAAWLPALAVFFILYFVVLPCLCRGSTTGQLLLHLRVVHLTNGSRVRFGQLLVRHLFLYVLEPLLIALDCLSVALIVVSLAGGVEDLLALLITIILPVLFILLSFFFFFGTYLRHDTFPHGSLSQTRIIIIPRKDKTAG